VLGDSQRVGVKRSTDWRVAAPRLQYSICITGPTESKRIDKLINDMMQQVFVDSQHRNALRPIQRCLVATSLPFTLSLTCRRPCTQGGAMSARNAACRCVMSE
jgi:hypothetical protein